MILGHNKIRHCSKEHERGEGIKKVKICVMSFMNDPSLLLRSHECSLYQFHRKKIVKDFVIPDLNNRH